MRILLTAATTFEIAPTVTWLREKANGSKANVLEFGGLTVEVLFTGIGLTATAFALGHRFGAADLPQLAIQAGVGGALDARLKPGDVVRISRERFGDLGAEGADGSFLTLHDIGLPPGPPFDENGWLVPPVSAHLPFPDCTGLTVNRVNGSAGTIAAVKEKFPEAQVESMEGAAFFYACLQTGVEPLQLRAISNYVEPRNREAWRMGEAIQQLNEGLRKVLGAFIA